MAHSWHFFRAGGVDQVSLRNGADLVALDELDPKLWVALAMPTREVDVDPATLDLLDADHDKRIRVPEILAAVKWVESVWKDPGDLFAGGDEVRLSAIKDPRMAAAARRVLADVGRKDAASITLADAQGVTAAFAKTVLNGDGVVIAESAADDATRAVLDEVIATMGAVTDRSGKPGVDQAKLDAFFAEVDQLAAWAKTGDGDVAVQPLGEQTAAAAEALAAVHAKIDDHFARCRLVAFDPRAAAALAGQDADFVALGARMLSSSSDEIARLPLARIEPGRPLPLTGAINPAWSTQLASFATAAVTPLLGARDALSSDDHAAIVARLAGYHAWRAARPTTAVETLGVPRIRALADSPARTTIAALIAADLELADEYAEIAGVEKLVRYQRDLVRVVRNFVNFADFYGSKDGIFQVGTLYLDARGCNLCVAVSDGAKHALLAGMSAAHLVYCDIRRGAETKVIAAAFTNGDTDYLMVGRNGVFYDRDGKDWDATITKIVSNPLSVRQAFWAPYKKLARMIEEQVAKRAAAAEAASEGKVSSAASAVAHVDKAAAPPPAAAAPPAGPPAKKGVDVGTVAAIGVAIGGVGAMLVAILATFTGLGAWMPIGLLVLLLLISGPSMLLAWFKLRQRNLGPILDANGWALNGRARVNVAFGAALTDLAVLPRGATRTLDDPYADKKSPWRLYAFLIVLLVLAGTWYVGRLDRWLPSAVTSTSVLGKHAPAAREAAPPPAPAPAPEAPAPAPA